MKQILISSGKLIHSADFTETKDFTNGHVAQETFIKDIELLQAPKDDPSKALPQHLLSMLSGPLSIPRSHEWDKLSSNQPNKDNVAIYIWQKLGLYCTFICAHRFRPQEDSVRELKFQDFFQDFQRPNVHSHS